MSFHPRNQNNIIQFPKATNKEVVDQDKKTALAVAGISQNMMDPTWDIAQVPNTELATLSQFGEVIEFTPIVARRLIANLATEVAKRRLDALNPYGDELI